MAKADVIPVFPDTNVLLHFPALDGLDWCHIAGDRPVAVHLTAPVIAELNRVKETGSTKAIRTRAATVQKQLRRLFAEHGTTARISEGVILCLDSIDAVIDPSDRLNPSVADDLLLAQVLAFTREAGQSALVVTDDSGLGLMIKAKARQIETVEPPADSRLSLGLDPVERENKVLQERLARLQRSEPDLQITFGDGKTFHHLKMRRTCSDDDVANRMAKLREKFPSLVPPVITELDQAKLAHLPLGDIATLTNPLFNKQYEQQRTLAYNKELEVFFGECESVWKRNLDIEARSAQLDISLRNTGSVPAHEPRVTLHFPNGFKLVEKSDARHLLSPLPRPPRQPDEPLNLLENLSFTVPRIPGVGDFRIGGLSIEESNSYHVTRHWSKLRQGDDEALEPMIVLFEEKPFSFSIDVEIVADNLHDKSIGRLDVIASSNTAA